MQTIDFYDFSNNDDYVLDRKIAQRELVSKDIIIENMGPNKTFLEIGCGNGVFLRYIDSFLTYSIKYIGLDYSQYQLDAFKNRKFKHVSNLDLIQCNIEDTVAVADNSVDLVYMGEIIEHLYNPDFLIKEAYRILRTEGSLVITTPNLNAWYNRFLMLIGYQPIFYETSIENSMNGFGFLKKIKKDSKPVGHVRIFNKMSLTDLLVNNGFKVVSIKGVSSGVGPAILDLIEKPINLFSGLSSNMVFLSKK